jgi:hypothetical protein
MALCKYHGLEPYYHKIMVYFYGASNPLTKMPPDDEAFDLLDQMLSKNIYARQAMELIPDEPAFIPLSAGKYVAKLGWGLMKAMDAKLCLPTGVFSKGSKACLKFNDASRFSYKINMVKRALALTYKSLIGDALLDGETQSCAGNQ